MLTFNKARQGKGIAALGGRASSPATVTPAKLRTTLSRAASTASKRLAIFNYCVDSPSSSEEEDMSSPREGKAKKRNVTSTAPRQLSLRNSTFAPSNLAEIPSMETAAELAELAKKKTVSSRLAKPLVQDFGHFKVGTAQYSHAHWNKEGRMKAMSSPLTETSNRLQVDPDTLKADAESVRGEICEAGSTTSLSSLLSSASLSDNVNIPRTRPYEIFAEKSSTEISSLKNDASASATNAEEKDDPPTEIVEEDHDTSSNTIRDSEDSASTIIIRSPKTSPKTTDVTDKLRTPPVMSGQPDGSEHGQPLIQPDPFALSELTKNWKGKDARELKKDLQAKCEDKRKPQNEHILNIAKKSSATDQLISIYDAAFEGPDMAAPKTPGRKSLTGSFGRARGATLRTPGSDASKRTTSSTLRSVSDIFRGKSTPEERYDKDKVVRDRETYLRTVTSTLPNPNNTMFPKHPNTNKPWMHRNLRCTNCTDDCCSKCGRACCAHKAAIEGQKNHPHGEQHARAAGHVTEIAKFMPYGRELPTFMKCTDCEKIFCPDCLGECCDPICKLVVCRGCKSDPWVNCDWHAD